jgi:hypothetical protein
MVAAWIECLQELSFGQNNLGWQSFGKISLPHSLFWQKPVLTENGKFGAHLPVFIVN